MSNKGIIISGGQINAEQLVVGEKAKIKNSETNKDKSYCEKLEIFQKEASILPLYNQKELKKIKQAYCSEPIEEGPTIFVSYAHENADASRLIADTLLTLGFVDVWLDRKKLIGGDDWSDRIDDAIEKSVFFMPILSKEADARREGVFWNEWRTALERARRIKDVYLLPVGIDIEFPCRNNYRRISDGSTAAFFDKHLFHAPQGILTLEARTGLELQSKRFNHY